MDQVLLVGVVAIAILIASLCRRFDVAAPLPLVAAGILLGLVPRMADLKISPQVVLDLALPPLLFAAALQTSYLALRAYTRLLLLLSVGLVVVTAVVVGVVAHQVLPGLPLAAAIALGAVLAPTDAVTATVIGRRSGLPRKALTLLEGESLMNDGTALTVFRVAVVAATAGSITAGRTASILTLSVAGGIAIGLLGGFGLRWLLERYDDALVENTITLLAPFAVYFVAEGIQASGFLAVVIAGLILAHSSSSRLGYATRLQLSAVWSVLTFLLESLAFLVVGLQVPSLISRLDVTNLGTERLLVAFVVIFAAVIVTRFVWVFPATFLPRWSSRVREHEKPASWQAVAVVAWAGMRGPVSLFAALGLPLTTDNGEPFPLRDVLVLITAMVVVGGLVLQSLTLGPLIRRLGVVSHEEVADTLSEAEAQHHAAQASLSRLDELLEEGPQPPEAVVRGLRAMAERRANAAWERLGGPTETPTGAYRRLRRAMVEAEREVFVRFRDEGRLPEEVFRRALRELDIEEAALDRD